MLRFTVPIALCACCLVTVIGMVVVAAEPSPPLSYALVELTGKLMRRLPPPEQRLGVEDDIAAGDVLQTGWFSTAEITSPEAGAHFLVRPRTRIRLATDAPGVLLELQRGRLRAIFDALSEGQSSERMVTTPSAVLAVRGTEYGVSVNGSGDTEVVVFAGTVEVTSATGVGPSVMVPAGQWSSVARGKAPTSPAPHSLRPEQWERGRSPASSDERRGSTGTTTDRVRSPRAPMGSSRSSGTDRSRSSRGGGL